MRFKTGIIIIIVQISILILIVSSVAVRAENSNLIRNPGFEDGETFARYWETVQWDKNTGATEFILDDKIKRSGKKSACIINNYPNDSRYRQEVELEGSSYYRVSCWVKTENIGSNGKGANISIEGRLDSSRDIKGTTSGWELLELYCKTGKNGQKIFVTFGLGGYSSINTGKAWFDDVMVERLESLPSGVVAADLSERPPVTGGASNKENAKTAYNTPLSLFTLLFFAATIAAYAYLRQKDGELPYSREQAIIWSMLVVALLMRLLIAPNVEGFTIDTNCFKAWALAAARDLTNFYVTDMFVDYPPFYIYVLFIIGKIANMHSMADNLDLLVKLPSMLADLATSYLLYRLARKRFNSAISILAAGAYAFNPAVLINSTIWGQVDSFFTLMIVGTLVLTASNRLNWAAALMTASILMKPQGIIIAPVLFFELLRRKNVKVFVKAALTAVGTSILIILPFSFNQSPLWVIKLFIKTGSEYPYASLNAFNLFSLLGANNAPENNSFLGFDYGVWGFVFDIAIAVLIGFLYYRGRNAAALPFISALVLASGAFVLSARMHERYLFPAIALALLAFIYIKDRRLALIFMIFTLTVYTNTNAVLYRFLAYDNGHIPANDAWLLFFSLINVTAFIYLVKVTWDIAVKNKVDLHSNMVRAIESRSSFQTGKNTSWFGGQGTSCEKFKIDRADILIMSIMTLLYTVAALINLGSLKAPSTFWEPANAGESVTLDLGRMVEISRISWYCGINRAIYDGTNKYLIQYLDQDGKYKNLGTLEKRDVCTWKHMDVRVTTNRLRLIVQNPHGTINEIGFFEAGSKEPVNGVKVIEVNSDPGDRGDARNLVDEQELVQYWSSYKTGTYFDEVYHARTAYEYLNRIEPMEWTHPPLGKIIISLGIALFGMNPFGWRIMGTLFGAAMIPLMYLFGRKIFHEKLYGFLAAFLMMFDFMHFAQTRIATIDVYATFFIILMYYFMYDYFVNKSYNLGFKKSLKPLFWSGLFFGLGAASKWIGIYAGGGLALLFFLAKFREYMDYRKIINDRKSKKPAWVKDFIPLYVARTMLYCVLFFVVIPAVIYTLSYIPYMLVPGNGPEVIINNQKAMFKYHSKDVLGATHSFSSQWWSWPFILKPIWFYKGEGMAPGKASSIVSMGNPAIWWAGVAIVVTIIFVAAKKCSQMSRKVAASIAGIGVVMLFLPGIWKWGVVLLFAAAFVIIENMDIRLGVIFTAMSFQYLPWVFVERLSFIYHFFSTVPFLILCIVFAAKFMIECCVKSRLSAVISYSVIVNYLVLVAALFIMFYPVLSGLVVSRDYIDTWLRWFKETNSRFLWFENVYWYF